MNKDNLKHHTFLAARLGLLALLSLALAPSAAIAQNMSPTGLWKSFKDDKSPKGLIRVWEKDGKLFGKIEKLFKAPNEDQNPNCTKCKGDEKDKPIIGMTMLWDLKKDGNEWSGGQILDPDTGKTYKCKLEVADGGKTLKVRGFMGFAMIGKTDEWERVE